MILLIALFLDNYFIILQMTELLSKPYLTTEEEKYQVLAKERREQYVPKWILQRKKAWLKRDSEVSNIVQ